MDDGVHIKTFTEMFGTNGFVAGICVPDYGPVFTEAIGLIDSACAGFEPPG